MTHITDVIEEEVIRLYGTNSCPKDAWHTSIYEEKRADLTQSMKKSALAVLDSIEQNLPQIDIRGGYDADIQIIKDHIATLRTQLLNNK